MTELHLSPSFSSSVPPCSGCSFSSPSDCACLQEFGSIAWGWSYTIVPMKDGNGFLVGRCEGQRRVMARVADLNEFFRQRHAEDNVLRANRRAAEAARLSARGVQLEEAVASLPDLGISL